jgi:diguanylate cyclase (GGDEF)-like protein
MSVPIPKVGTSAGPWAGYEAESIYAGGESFLSSIASARHEAQTLFELSQELGSSLSLIETLSLVSVRLRKLIPHDSFVTFTLRENALVSEFVAGDNFRPLSMLTIPLGEGLSGWVARNLKPIVNGDPSGDIRYSSDSGFRVMPRSALSVPLESVSGLIGVLTLYHSQPDVFSGEHLRILRAVTSKIGISIENAQKYSQAETSALIDYLTGLPNARSMVLHLDGELARCKREGSSIAVMACDLDGFKEINDRYGHLEGDKALKLFAKLLQSAFREYDYVARVGGDEFVVVAPKLTPEAASEKAAHLNTLAQMTSQQIVGEDLLSLSVGVSFYGADGTEAEKLLLEADRRMYAVKETHHTQRKSASAETKPKSKSAASH